LYVENQNGGYKDIPKMSKKFGSLKTDLVQRPARYSPTAAPRMANPFESRLFPPQEKPWISGVTAKQSGYARSVGAEQQQLLDPRSKAPLATDWHGRALNDHVYTGPLHEGQTVFKYKPLPKGTMAAKLEQPVYSPPKQEPTGRTRTSDFFEAEVPLYQ